LGEAAGVNRTVLRRRVRTTDPHLRDLDFGVPPFPGLTPRAEEMGETDSSCLIAALFTLRAFVESANGQGRDVMEGVRNALELRAEMAGGDPTQSRRKYIDLSRHDRALGGL
jgi:hypothetical protein